MNEIFCPSCGRPNAGQSRFCISCGGALPASPPTQLTSPINHAAPTAAATATPNASGSVERWWKRRSGRTRLGLVVGTVLVLLAAGSALGNAEPTAPVAQVEASDQPTATPEPTPTSTPEPTPRPTPEPTPISTGSGEWLSYAADRLEWIDGEFNPAIAEWETDTGDAFVSAMNAMPVWEAFLHEQSALVSVSPHACFAEFHANWVAMVDLLYEGYDQLTDAGIARDYSLLATAMTTLEQGNTLFESSNESITPTFDSCR